MPRTRPWLYAVLALAGGFVGGAIATMFVSSYAIAARHVHKLEAEQFVMVGSDGVQRATLEVTKDGIAALAMYDVQGRDRAELRVGKNGGASVGLFSQNGSHRVLIAEGPTRAGIAIYGTNGRQLVNLTATANNEPSLTLYDPTSGRARAGLGVASNGTPALVMFDQNGRDRAELHVRNNGKPGLALADESGRTVAGLPEGERGISSTSAR